MAIYTFESSLNTLIGNESYDDHHVLLVLVA